MTVLKTIQLLGGVAALFTAVSCGSSPPPNATPLTEHRPSSATQATKQLGEECTLNGHAICLSRVCGHFAALPDKGYFCTRSCDSAQNCPQHWKCNQAYPTPQGRLCVPPSNWDGKVALLSDGSNK